MYKTEKQLTTKQNKVIYEEVYFNTDMSQSNYGNNGYLLTYPNKFSQNPSQDKSIGIRRIKVIPPTHSFSIAACYYDGERHETNYIACEYQSENTLQEILVDLIPKFDLTVNQVTYCMKYNYDPNKGELAFTAYKVQGGQTQEIPILDFEFSNRTDYNSFLSMLNQPYYQDLPDEGSIGLNIIKCANVWNRTPLYVHASFSDSKNHYVCMTNDYWEKPSKLFYDNVHGLEFTIYFTTDGVNKIVPYSANKLLELSFILRTNLM